MLADLNKEVKSMKRFSVFFSMIVLGIFLLSFSNPVAIAAPKFGPTPKNEKEFPPRKDCRVVLVQVKDPDPPLNLRSSPEVSPENVIRQLNNGTALHVVSEKDGWLQVKDFGTPQREGWVALNRTEYTCAYFREPITSFPFESNDSILGTGTHEYVLDLQAGQFLKFLPLAERGTDAQGRAKSYYRWPDSVSSVDAGKRVPHSPSIHFEDWWRSPSNENSAEPSEWLWKVERSGRYIITYESLGKGIQYAFRLETAH